MSDTAVIFSILAMDKTKGAFKSVGKGLAELFAGKEIFDFGKESISAAENMQKTQQKVQAVFGSSADSVLKFGESAAKGSGLSADAADAAAAKFGQLGAQAGLSGEKLSAFAVQNTKLASDIASFNNADPAAVQEALTKAYGGSVKALKPYGVLLDNASIKAEALSLGLIHANVSTVKVAAAQNNAQKAQEAYNKAIKQHGKDSQQAKDASIKLATADDSLKKATAGITSALTPQQKVLAAQALVLQQASKQQGNFAKNSGDLKNQQQILTAEFENAKDKLGSGLLPVVTKFATVLVGVIGFVEAHSGWMGPLIAGIAAVVAGLKVWSVVQELLNIELDANPIGAIVLAIVALVAIIIVAIKWHKQIEAVAKATWNGVVTAAKAVWNWLKSNWPYLLGILTGPFGLAVAWIFKHWNTVLALFKGAGHAIASAASGMFDGIKNAFKSAINFVIRGWDSLHFGIPGFSFGPIHFGGFSLGVPQIPQLAAGAIIRARPGGTLVNIGEGSHDEAVMPLPKGGAALGGGQKMTIELVAAPGDQVAELLLSLLRPRIRGTYSGNVNFALAGHA